MNKLIDNYEKSIIKLIEKFVDKYFTYDDWSQSDYHIIWRDMWIIEISDYYFNISDIYIAIKYNIESEILFKRYDDTMEKETKFNLYSYKLCNGNTNI